MDGKHTPGPWRIEGSIHSRLGEIGKIVSAGVNDYGDGPRSYVAKITEVSPTDLALMLSAPDLLAALDEGRRAIGSHYAPSDCYATGPLTGDPIRDLVQCPACSFIGLYHAIKKATTS